MLVFEKSKEWCAHERLNEVQSINVQLAALFHDLGYRTNPDDHESESCDMFRSFASSMRLRPECIDAVCQLIHYTNKHYKDHTIQLAAIMHDIDRVSMGLSSFYESGLLLKKEWAHFKGLVAEELEWIEFQIDYLQRTEFKTVYGQKAYDPQRLINLENLLELAASLQG